MSTNVMYLLSFIFVVIMLLLYLPRFLLVYFHELQYLYLHVITRPQSS